MSENVDMNDPNMSNRKEKISFKQSGYKYEELLKKESMGKLLSSKKDDIRSYVEEILNRENVKIPSSLVEHFSGWLRKEFEPHELLMQDDEEKNGAAYQRGDSTGIIPGTPAEARLQLLAEINSPITDHHALLELLHGRVVSTLTYWEVSGDGNLEERFDFIMTALYGLLKHPLFLCGRVRVLAAGLRGLLQLQKDRKQQYYTSRGTLADWISSAQNSTCRILGAYYYDEILRELALREGLDAEAYSSIIYIQANNLAARLSEYITQSDQLHNKEGLSLIWKITCISVPAYLVSQEARNEIKAITDYLQTTTLRETWEELFGQGEPQEAWLLVLDQMVNAPSSLLGAPFSSEPNADLRSLHLRTALVDASVACLRLWLRRDDPENQGDAIALFFNAANGIARYGGQNSYPEQRAFLNALGLWWAAYYGRDLTDTWHRLHGLDCFVNMASIVVNLPRTRHDSQFDVITKIASLIPSNLRLGSDFTRVKLLFQKIDKFVPPVEKGSLEQLRDYTAQIIDKLAQRLALSKDHYLLGKDYGDDVLRTARLVKEFFFSGGLVVEHKWNTVMQDCLVLAKGLAEDAERFSDAFKARYEEINDHDEPLYYTVKAGIVTEEAWRDIKDKAILPIEGSFSEWFLAALQRAFPIGERKP